MIRKLILSGILASTLAFAQRGGGGGSMTGMGEGGENSRGGMGNMGYTPSKPNKLDIWTNILKLEKDQKKEVRSIMDEGQKQAAPIREQMAKAHVQIAEAIKAGKSQDEVDQAVKNYSSLETQMTGIEMSAFSKIYKLLDSDQKAKTRPVFTMMGGIFKGKNWAED
jgi:Spy/CpxP family protein refolding chaperone